MTGKLAAEQVLSVIALTVALTGCGGGEARLTRAQFLKRGNAICAQAQAEEVKLAAQYRRQQRALVEEQPYVVVPPAIVPPLERQLRRLRAMNPPEADQKKLRAIFKGIAAGIEDVTYDPLDLFYRESDPFEVPDTLAREYGLDVCARSSHRVIRFRAG